MHSTVIAMVMSVAIVLIDHAPSVIHLTERFTYPNQFLAAVGHRDLGGSTVIRNRA